MKVYWTSIEYLYIQDDLKGGFVYGFVNAKDAKEALGKFINDLNSNNIQEVDVEFISPYDEKTEWDTKKQTNEINKIYNLAKKSEEVIWDVFYDYEDD